MELTGPRAEPRGFDAREVGQLRLWRGLFDNDNFVTRLATDVARTDDNFDHIERLLTIPTDEPLEGLDLRRTTMMQVKEDVSATDRALDETISLGSVLVGESADLDTGLAELSLSEKIEVLSTASRAASERHRIARESTGSYVLAEWRRLARNPILARIVGEQFGEWRGIAAEAKDPTKTPEDQEDLRHLFFENVIDTLEGRLEDVTSRDVETIKRGIALFKNEAGDWLAKRGMIKAYEAQLIQARDGENAQWLERLDELSTDYSRLRARWGIFNPRRLEKERGKQDVRGVYRDIARIDVVDSEGETHPLGFEKGLQVAVFVWKLRGTLRDMGTTGPEAVEAVQNLLGSGIEEEQYIRWVSGKLIDRVGEQGDEAAANFWGGMSLEEVAELTRHHWSAIRSAIKDHARPGTNVDKELNAVSDVLYMRQPRGQKDSGQRKRAESVPLNPVEMERRQLLRTAALEVYQTAGVINTKLLPQEAKSGRWEASGPTRSSSDTVQFKINPERIELLYALKDAFSSYGADWHAENVLDTGKAELPYVATVFTYGGVTFTIAECPEDGNATYFHVARPGESDWETDLGARRSIALQNSRVDKLEHTADTILLHMRGIEGKLIAMGLPEQEARRASRTLLRNMAAQARTDLD